MLLDAVDISKEILSFAEKGIYAPETSQLVNASIFERLTDTEKIEMFDWEGDQAKVKSWLREGITWRLGDAADPELLHTLGPQDIVVANNFLCHMAPADAEACLGNIARVVSPCGYLFVSGVDCACVPPLPDFVHRNRTTAVDSTGKSHGNKPQKPLT